MEEKKLYSRFCPKCGEVCQVDDIAKVSLCSGINVNMTCEQGHKWTEFYSLSYQGYWWSGKRYDSYGEEIANETI